MTPQPPARTWFEALRGSSSSSATRLERAATHRAGSWTSATHASVAGSTLESHGIALPEPQMTASTQPVLVPSERTSAKRGWRPPRWLVLALLASALLAASAYELHTSALQSLWIVRWAHTLSYQVEPGANRSPVYPASGPYDVRFGYAYLPAFTERLWARGFQVESQARFSPALRSAATFGLTPPYREKDAAGLHMLAANGVALFAFADPGFRYQSFEATPDLLMRSLLYVENRELLDASRPYANPAVEWDRLARAGLDLGGKQLGATGNVPGGSTLATQIEKYRHSPRGLTSDPREKLRQIASATVRAYAEGRDTSALRQRLAVTYLNTLPLSATPVWGEVFGIGDGLRAYYGADPALVSALLRSRPRSAEEAAERGLAFRQALSLLLSARRPTGLLRSDERALTELSAQYLRRMAQDGAITPELRDAALAAELRFAPAHRDMERVAADKGVARMRAWLGATLGTSPYELDRLDLTVATTLDATAQAEATRRLRELASPAAVEALGLRQKNALASGDPARVVYAFTLYEQTPQGNLLRVHADSLGAELDVNDGIKLDLGSTAKLRTLVTYLEIVAELHAEYAGASPETLRTKLGALHEAGIAPDPLTYFVLDELSVAPALPLPALLDAALDRRYSASPHEGFFTGGGVHHFANFDSADNARVLTVRESFRRSVNLPFVRVMRDIVRYENARLVRDATPAAREAALRRYADREGRALLEKAQRHWQGAPREQILGELVARRAATARRVAALLRSVNPSGDRAWFEAELAARAPKAAGLSDAAIARLYDTLGPGTLGLSDRAWIARVQPIELWLAAQLWANPAATRAELLAASEAPRAEATAWLFKTRNKRAQERRLRELRERDAFVRIHARWARLGYPFDSLVPSYATAIGTSADRPAALAELMGIVNAGGLRLPERRVESLAFARGTPYETNFAPAESAAPRVLDADVARSVRAALGDVVAHGTARRVASTFETPEGDAILIAGKTGTGDHRYKTFARGGAQTSERVLNRSAVFAFMIGERHFGVVTAYVAGPSAAEYRFTSALPLEVLRALSPALVPLVGAAPIAREADALAAPPATSPVAAR
jgi:membrane peptidoglycan carboxypeptidase